MRMDLHCGNPKVGTICLERKWNVRNNEITKSSHRSFDKRNFPLFLHFENTPPPLLHLSTFPSFITFLNFPLSVALHFFHAIF
jgi:hypothetical protein